MRENFSYYMPVRICCEAGISKKIAQYIDGENVVMICDPFLYNNGVAKSIGDSMEGKNVVYFHDVEPNPSCESVDAAAAGGKRSSCRLCDRPWRRQFDGCCQDCFLSDDQRRKYLRLLQRRYTDASETADNADVYSYNSRHRQRSNQCGRVHQPQHTR